ncbi:unnamed protein product [Orchesella dallaii]|uniref:Beta-1,4-mannosyl-glycoprotein 4-beta-N-acetylglucosaminyltransferase n=1 Tax=Orchesella dallaii TaxID=48710 RepID=A0ABP1RLS9_9HEXA
MKQIGNLISPTFSKVIVICITCFLYFYYREFLPKLSSKYYSKFSTENSSSFISNIRQYPWAELLYAYQNKKNDTSEFSKLSSILLSQLTPFLITEPNVNTNTSCGPPPFQFPSTLPPCVKLNKPRNIAVLLQHGFDADTLEIHFHELDELVDKFFIIESTLTTYLGASKPLIWESLKKQHRFEKFVPKVVHFVLDDAELLKAKVDVAKVEKGEAQGNIYNIEIIQEQMRWLKFLRWNQVTKLFGSEDLLGFGDVDEIPNRNVIYYLKHCKLFVDPVDIGIWFPYGRIDQAFRTDFPVGRHPFTHGDPTYWTFKTALKYSKKTNHSQPPTRQRGKSRGFAIGGMHMTYYGYLPFRMTKLLTTAEVTKVNVQDIFVDRIRILVKELRLNETLSKSEEIETFKNVERELAKTPMVVMNRIVKLETLKTKAPWEYNMLVKLPWFYDCNRERYPLWEGKHDTRLDH